MENITEDKATNINITIIGVVPPCPRCKRIHDLAIEAVSELGAQAEIKKIAYDSEEAKQYGRAGTAHDIAEWAQMKIEWSKIRDIAAEGWSPELDNLLMPCKERADVEGWLMTPVLLLDDKVIFTGYVPEKEYIKAAVKQHLQRGDDKI
jgi:hypothetical protein